MKPSSPSSFWCKDRIMVRPPAAAQKFKVIIASAGNAEIQVVEIVVGTTEAQRGWYAAVESGALGDGGRRLFLGEEVIVVPMTHVIALSCPDPETPAAAE
jgi:hypothetical protein